MMTLLDLVGRCLNSGGEDSAVELVWQGGFYPMAVEGMECVTSSQDEYEHARESHVSVIVRSQWKASHVCCPTDG